MKVAKIGRTSRRPPTTRVLNRKLLDGATAALSEADPRLGEIIARVGPCTMLPDQRGTHFDAIARSIVYQQLSGKAAGTIHARFVERIGVDGGMPTPEQVVDHDVSVLRECGLSTAKTAAVRDLAAHVIDGRLPIDEFDTMSDDAIIESLVQVRGIGPWTAQMFLMFRLGRPDVLPVLDLGVKKGAQVIHRLRKLPDETRLEKLARPWRPWRSVASWYCWRALELED
jgi:DNA-3-methyladenine glycosylase II